MEAPKNELTLSLLENAIDSLNQGLVFYEEGLDDKKIQFKYAALSLSLYIELSLKYFVYTINPILVFSNCFSEKFNKKKTISMFEALNFLKNLDKFKHLKDKKHIENLEWLYNEANSVKHYEIKINLLAFRKIAGKVLKILDDIYKEHGISIENHLINSQQDNFYNTLLDDYKRDLMFAIDDAEKKADFFSAIDNTQEPINENVLINCPNCGENTFVLNHSYSQYECTFCNHNEIAAQCEHCGEIFPECEAETRIENLIRDEEDNQKISNSTSYWCSKHCVSTYRGGED